MAGHSHAQENDSKKRKADALNPNPDTAGHTKKRPYQNGTISAREFSPEPRPASRPIPEQVACTPLAPRALTATVSAGETALIRAIVQKGVQTLRDTVFKAIRSEDLAILI